MSYIYDIYDIAFLDKIVTTMLLKYLPRELHRLYVEVNLYVATIFS